MSVCPSVGEFLKEGESDLGRIWLALAEFIPVESESVVVFLTSLPTTPFPADRTRCRVLTVLLLAKWTAEDVGSRWFGVSSFVVIISHVVRKPNKTPISCRFFVGFLVIMCSAIWSASYKRAKEIEHRSYSFWLPRLISDKHHPTVGTQDSSLPLSPDSTNNPLLPGS